jgi:hypothetical protein
MPHYGDELRRRGIKIVHHPYVRKVRDYLISHGSEFDVMILSRCDFWNRLSRNGVEKTRLKYSVEVARQKLRRLFSDEHLRAFGTGSPNYGRQISVAAGR